jgi:hypothetical protein
MSNEQLYNYYDFNDTGMIFYQGPTNLARLIRYKFPKDGKYLVVTQWYNKCLSQDTFFFTRITVNCNKVTGIETIIKGEPKVIGMYDMMGRPIIEARENEVIIYRYSNGTTIKKVIQK